MHPKFQGSKYRIFRALIFVATGLSGIAPLIHGLNVFGISQMMRKTFPYTLAKVGRLLSGTSFYAVHLLISRKRENNLNACVSEDQVSRKVGILADLTYVAPIRSFTC